MSGSKEIEEMVMTNGKTVGEINREVRRAVERIYLEAWAKGVSVPFRDAAGKSYLANPDGSEDFVRFNPDTRTYTILSHTVPSGCGRFAYLLQK